MKINKEMLAELSKLPDAELWQSISTKAAGFGYNLPKDTPAHEDMEKIRSFMRDADKINTAQILKLMATLKRKG